MKPKSKAIPLPKKKAIEVADHMLTHIERELYWALEIEASMEAANEVIQGGLKGKKFYGANTFNVVSNALAVELSLVVAKLFEIPLARRGKSIVDRHNKSDVASIPMLVRLLKQKRCRNHYASMSEEWGFGIGHLNGSPSKVLQTLDKLVWRYGHARRNRRFQLALARVKDFRNNRAAHALMNQPAHPIYADLHLMVDLARDTLQDLRLVMRGENVDLLEREEIRRAEAAHFWSVSLNAAVAADER